MGDNVFPKSSPTRYRKAGGDFYSIEAIYLAWLLKDATGAEYMKQTREHGLTVGFVSVTERKHVVDWLEGRTSDQDRVVPLDCELSDYIGREI
jgi:parafibromin